MLKDIKRIHFIGIGGYGMSALALVLLDLGYEVSGSDEKQSAITEKLAAEGAVVHQGHSAEYVTGAGLVVYSTAIPEDNAELRAAKDAGMMLWHRSELLAHFVNGRFGIAIAGTHGKTTTTSMVAKVLTKGRLDPTAFIGGILSDFGGNARIGKTEYVVAEADESDNSFLRYRPALAVVTNIEQDHMEHYKGDFDLLLDGYRRFLQNIKPEGTAVLFAEDPYLDTMIPTQIKKLITYGIHKGDFCARRVRTEGWGSRFTVTQRGEELGEIRLYVPGEHNVQNALAAVAVGLELGVSFADVREGLGEFRGADRRFQFLLEKDGIIVVDDYAHHPTEVKVTLKAARANKPKRIIVVFQPHRYTRTQFFLDEFADSFSEADKVFLHKIYAASEAPMPGVSSAELAERVRTRGVDARQFDDAEEIVENVLNMARPGDLIITMGAGDITELGHTLAARLRNLDHGEN
ncbi:MAG: UDP-N-acetylmuramate--L-alanine ligase [Bacillota bacterium]|nr:UDP-N-acetylmuramate--L-alanine ligase [Bacillota bacterium]MDW7683638.1 UDP-N-acetylmuramate--L-alanine ligase [Bacillota bacterium]